ncbi:MAG: hypothetical protein QOE69_1354 [Thermoleophilaceae bacterium]|nr:hypothetical protein [Thermoleophilaceae bacterium]
MDLRRLRVGEWLVGVAGLALLIALFLPWYEGGVEGTYFTRDIGADRGWTMYAPLAAAGGSLTGWQSLGALDVILALLALAAIAVPVVTATHRVPALPLAFESLLTLAAFVATLLVLFRVLNLPDWADGRDWGLWLAFASTLGIFASGLVAMRDERRAPSARALEKLPAPRPEGGT